MSTEDSNKKVWELAHEKAEEVRRKFESKKGRIDLLDICEYYDIDYYMLPLRQNIFGCIEKEGRNVPPKIVVSDSVKKKHRGYVLAHLLGHFFERDYANDLDYIFVDYLGKKYGLHEFYADEFAGALLMPEKGVLEMLEKGNSVVDIGKRFNVPLNFVRFRIEGLKKRGIYK